MLPPAIVTKDIDKYESPYARTLVRVLIWASFIFCGLYIGSLNSRHTDDVDRQTRLRNKIDSLRTVISVRDDSDNVRLRRRIDWFENLEHELKNKVNKLK